MERNFSRRDFLKYGAAVLEATRRLDGAALSRAGKLILPIAAGSEAIIGGLPVNHGASAEAAEYIKPAIPNKKVDFEINFPRVQKDGWSYSTFDPYAYLDFGPLGRVAEVAYPGFRAYYVEDGPADRYDQSMTALNGRPRTDLRGLLLGFRDLVGRLAKEQNLPQNEISSLGFCYANGVAGLLFERTLSENTVGGVHFPGKYLEALLALACSHTIQRDCEISVFHDGEPVLAEVTQNFYFPLGALSLDNRLVKVGYSGVSALNPSNPIRAVSALRSFTSPQHPDHIKSSVLPQDNPNGGWSVESQMPLWVALVYAKVPNPGPKDFEKAFGGVF